MKLIIDIPKDYYEIIKYDVDNHLTHYRPFEIIANGTALPKGHGKIIDVNEAINYIDDYAFGFFSFDDVPAIIEADTESEDKNEGCD